MSRPGPEVRTDDGEVLGFLVPHAAGWVPTTVFGFPLAPAVERAVAVELLHARGLAVLSDRWWCDGRPGRLVEVSPDHVRWSADDGAGGARFGAAEAVARVWPLATPRLDAVRAGVGDNAAWCAAVAAAQRIPAEGDGSVWSTGEPMPVFFPSAVTLREGVAATTVTTVVPAGAVGVKDSFADVDLGSAGFTELLHGRWVAAGPLPRPAGGRERVEVVGSPEQVADFAAASVHQGLDWTALHTDPTVDLVVVDSFGPSGWERLAQAVLTSGVGGAGVGGAGVGGAGAVGISNVEVVAGGSTADAWRALGWFAGRRFPGRLVVGWEPVGDVTGPLLAGFVDVGPLRVWVR